MEEVAYKGTFSLYHNKIAQKKAEGTIQTLKDIRSFIFLNFHTLFIGEGGGERGGKNGGEGNGGDEVLGVSPFDRGGGECLNTTTNNNNDHKSKGEEDGRGISACSNKPISNLSEKLTNGGAVRLIFQKYLSSVERFVTVLSFLPFALNFPFLTFSPPSFSVLLLAL